MNKAVTLRELLSDRFNTGLTNLRVLKKTRDVEGYVFPAEDCTKWPGGPVPHPYSKGVFFI